MHNEPNFENRMLQYIAGSGDPDLARHIASCPACQEELVVVRELAAYREVTGGTLTDLPEGLTARLVALMPRIRPDLIPAKQPSLLDRARECAAMIVAELILDSGATPQTAGLRSAGGSVNNRTRHLAFVSDLADLDLEVALADMKRVWLVTGQLGMETVPPGLVIRFVPDDQDPLADDVEGTVRARIADDGYFTLTLASGSWIAAVTMDDATIVFRDIRL